MEGFLSFLGSDLFQGIVFPFSSAVLTAGIKYACKNDTHAPLARQDFAVGIDLMLASIFLYVIYMSKEIGSVILDRGVGEVPAEDLVALASSGWIVLIMFVIIFGVSVFVRKCAWDGNNDLKVVQGVLVPAIIGLGMLAIVSRAIS